MKEKKEEQNEVRLNFMVSKELRKNYKKHCINNDIDMSKRIRELMEMDLEGKI
nr:hypothetical protein [uncultured archaeon]